MRRYSTTERHPLYRTWCGMRNRCSNPNSHIWEYYGGRGIRVCERWEKSFAAFVEDMGERPPGTSIDRVNNDGNYEPGNCRWATPTEQARNQRKPTYRKRIKVTIRPARKLRKEAITWRGQTRSITDWAASIGISRRTLGMRLHHGWTLEQTMTTPNRSVTHTNVRQMRQVRVR